MKTSSWTVGFLSILSSQSQWRLVESRRSSAGNTAFFSARPSPNFIPSKRSPQPFPPTHNARQRSGVFPTLDTRDDNSRIHSGLFYSVDGKISSKQDTDNDNIDLSEVYQTVAEQDPLWYETYVINVLGADKAKEIGLPTLPVVPASSCKSTPPAEKVPSPAKKVEKIQENRKTSEDASEKIIKDSKDSLEQEKPEKASSKISETLKLEQLDENVVKNETDPKKDSTDNSKDTTSRTEKPVAIKDGIDNDDNDKKDKKVEVPATTAVEEPRRDVTTSKLSTTEKDLPKTLTREPIAASPVKSAKEVRPSTSESKAKEKELDSKEAEKPLRATAETKIELKIMEETQFNSSSVTASSVKPDVIKASGAKLSATNTTGVLIEKETSNFDSASVVQAQKSAIQSKQPTSTTPEEAKISLEDSAKMTDTPPASAVKPEDAQVVVFFDYAKGKKQAVPVSKFESLSYTLEEVGDLQADVLATILADSMMKPQTGVPPQWRISKAKSGTAKPGDVQLLSKLDAEKALKVEPVHTSPPSRRRDGAQGPRDTPGRRKGEPQAPSEPNNRRRAKTRPREKQAFNADGSKKSVYNVRGGTPTNRKKRTADPPTPKRWMDIDTFRDLLRTEAELRVSILGDGFSDAIKDESDWRLNLYKDWLWTLDKGIGNPIVPSRRDRTMQVPKSKPRKSGGKPRPKSRSPRRTRNE